MAEAGVRLDCVDLPHLAGMLHALVVWLIADRICRALLTFEECIVFGRLL